jgi:Na+-driven multidrug efflux pump
MTKSTRVCSIFVALLVASRVSGYALPKASLSSRSSVKTRSPLVPNIGETSILRMASDDETNNNEGRSESAANKDSLSSTKAGTAKNSSSIREMLRFAVPALGIFLANPLLSNIDNAFVGQTVGTEGLAALSPATICTDQMLYLFSFLSRATTGLVSRARGLKTDPDEKNEAAAKAGSAPLTVALMAGLLLSVFYAFCTPNMLSALNVTPALRGPAASYIYWRGAIAWAALAQSVCLSILLATRDAITPLKIVALAAGVNVIGDYLLCVFPLQWGVSGAAAATTFATIFSSAFMVRGLKKKGILPKIRLPSRKEMVSLMEFTGPLLGITITRLFGFVSMQRTAMTLGLKHTAAYQLCVNLMIFFLLFAEPLSQLSQTQLPELIDAGDGAQVKSNLKSVLSLGAATSLVVGGVAGLATFFGSSVFSSDPIVQSLAKGAAPSLFLAVATAIFAGKYGFSEEISFHVNHSQAPSIFTIFPLIQFCCCFSLILNDK